MLMLNTVAFRVPRVRIRIPSHCSNTSYCMSLVVLWRVWRGTLKRVVLYFEEGGVVLRRGWCGTLKRVIWYCMSLESGLILLQFGYFLCFFFNLKFSFYKPIALKILYCVYNVLQVSTILSPTISPSTESCTQAPTQPTSTFFQICVIRLFHISGLYLSLP